MTPEEFHKQLQDMMKRMGASGPMPPFPGMGATTGPDSGGTTQNDEETEERDLTRDFHFDLKPRDVKTHLDKWVIRQDEAKKVLAVALCDHYNHVLQVLEAEKNGDKDDRYNKNYAKQNVLLLGPTGVGKTYLIKKVAELIGVPFVKADATKFSETGYVGSDVEELVRDLVKAANGNIQLAQYGIIYIDEIDKIASSFGPNGGGKDVSGRGVQINLLKLMEDTEVNLF